ncbi:hypothetical protein ACI65C_009144 [Semiaphis heraclei]
MEKNRPAPGHPTRRGCATVAGHGDVPHNGTTNHHTAGSTFLTCLTLLNAVDTRRLVAVQRPITENMSDREGNNSNESSEISSDSDEKNSMTSSPWSSSSSSSSPLSLSSQSSSSYSSSSSGDYLSNALVSEYKLYDEDSDTYTHVIIGRREWWASDDPNAGEICEERVINDNQSNVIMPERDSDDDQNEAGIPERDSGDDQNEAGIPERDSGDDQNEAGIPERDSGDDQNEAGIPDRDSGNDQSDADMPERDSDDDQNEAGIPERDSGDDQNEAGIPDRDSGNDQSDADQSRGDPDDEQSDAVMPRGDSDDVQNDADMLCNFLREMAFELSLEEFIMKKMEDRPPRYEDIGKDRVVPFEVGPDEPPPLYQCIYYAYPAKYSHDDHYPYPYPPSTIHHDAEMDPDQPTTVTEVPTMMTAEVATDWTNGDEIIPSPESINENCEFPQLQDISQ